MFYNFFNYKAAKCRPEGLTYLLNNKLMFGLGNKMGTGVVVLVLAGSASARVAGKMGGYSNKKGGKYTVYLISCRPWHF